MKELRNICTINDIKVGDVIVWNDGTDNEVISVERQYVRVTHKGVAYTFHVNSLTSLKVYTPESVVVSSVKKRLPVVGEVWTKTATMSTYTCLDATPDKTGYFAWRRDDDVIVALKAKELVPPSKRPSNNLLADIWMNVYPTRDGGIETGLSDTARSCDEHNRPSRIGRINLLGVFVECDGREVLG